MLPVKMEAAAETSHGLVLQVPESSYIKENLEVVLISQEENQLCVKEDNADHFPVSTTASSKNRKFKQFERTVITEEQKEALQNAFNQGMTRVGSPLIAAAAEATGLAPFAINNWIGNYRRSFKQSPCTRGPKTKVYSRDLSAYNLFCRDHLRNKGSLKDIKQKWSSLEETKKKKYLEEAAALKERTIDLTPEMRELKIKKYFKQLKLEVSNLEMLGVETVIMSFDCQKPGLEVLEVSSKGAAAFLDSTDTLNNFALHFKGSSPSASCTKEPVVALVKKVQDIFNTKYNEAGGKGRLPYQSLQNHGITINASGLPGGPTLKKPSKYGRKQLEQLLKVADQIEFQIDVQTVGEEAQTCKTDGMVPAYETMMEIQTQTMKDILEAASGNGTKQMLPVKMETPEETSHGLVLQFPESSYIKEELEEVLTGQDEKQLCVKEDNTDDFPVSTTSISSEDNAETQNSDLDQDRIIHTGVKPFSCELCGHSFRQKSHLDRHRRIHTGEKPFSCDICGYSCNDKSNLNKHRRIHTGEKPFTCDLCGHSFSRKAYLDTHRRIHTGEKPFRCDFCGHSFSEKSSVKIHRRIHTGEKPFRCDFCGHSFNQKSHLARHRRIHTGEKPFRCDLCGHSFSEKSSVKKHRRIHIGEKPFTCDLCEHSSNRKSNLEGHRRVHSKKIHCSVIC